MGRELMQIYMLTLEVVDAYDAELSAAVVIAKSPAKATELIVNHLGEDWQAASVERIGVADPGSEPIVVAVDLT